MFSLRPPISYLAFTFLALFFVFSQSTLHAQDLTRPENPQQIASETTRLRDLEGFGLNIQTASDAAAWYRRELLIGLRRVITATNETDPLIRLASALEDWPQSATTVNQVLDDHRITSLANYAEELLGRLAQKRGIVHNLQTEVEREARTETRNALRDAQVVYSEYRISPATLAVIIDFYRRLRPDSTFVIDRRNPAKMGTKVARDLLELTRWPALPLREHDKGLAPVFYSSKLKRAFRDSWMSFSILGGETDFVEIWTQLANQDAGNLRFRQIIGFEERLLFKIRSIALHEDPLYARDLLIAFLSNFHSSEAIDQYGTDPRHWQENSGNREYRLAYLILRLSRMTSKEALIRFFETGNLPDTFERARAKIKISGSFRFSSQALRDFYKHNGFDFRRMPRTGSTTFRRVVLTFNYWNQRNKSCGDATSPRSL